MKILLTLLCISFSIILSAQTYTIDPQFKSDSSYYFSIYHSKTNNEDTVKAALVYLVECGFENTDEVLNIDWTYIDVMAYVDDSICNEVDKDTQGILDLYKGVNLKLQLNKENSAVTLVNYKEAKDNLLAMFEKVYNSDAYGVDEDIRSKIKEVLEPTFNTPEIMLSGYFPHVPLFYEIYTLTLDTDSIFLFEYEMQSPFGSGTIKYDGELSIDSITDNALEISKILAVDSVNMYPIIDELVEKFEVPKEDMSEFKESLNLLVDLGAVTYHTYDLERKIITRTLYQKYIDVLEFGNYEEIQILLLDEDPFYE